MALKNNNKPQSVEKLKYEVWGDSFLVSDTAFKSLIHKLRKKVGKESIQNISSVGYYLDLKE